jgi:hypothetical protein
MTARPKVAPIRAGSKRTEENSFSYLASSTPVVRLPEVAEFGSPGFWPQAQHALASTQTAEIIPARSLPFDIPAVRSRIKAQKQLESE